MLPPLFIAVSDASSSKDARDERLRESKRTPHGSESNGRTFASEKQVKDHQPQRLSDVRPRSLVDSLWRLALWCAWRAFLGYAFFARPRVNGAYVAVWLGSDILLIRNSYRGGLSFPAGNLRKGEQARDAAVRELKEEVGIDVAPGELQEIERFRLNHSFLRDHVTIFELRCDETPAVRVDGREVVAARFVDAAAALSEQLAPVCREYLNRHRDRQGHNC